MKKNIRHEFGKLRHDSFSIALLVLLPALIVILFGTVVRTDIKGTRVAVLDSSHDAVTTVLVNRFEQNPYFTVVCSLSSPAEIENAFSKGEIDLAIVFGNSFAENMMHLGEMNMQIIADGTDNQAAMRTSYAERLMQDYQRELMMSAGKRPMYQIVPNMHLLYNPMQRGDINVVPGSLSLILLLAGLLIGSMAVVGDKENNDWQEYTDHKRLTYLYIGRFLPRLLLMVISLAIAMAAVIFVGTFANAKIDNILAWSGIALLYVAVAVAMGILFSSISKNSRMSLLLCGMVMLGLSILLCGMMFPVDSMPGWLQWIAAIIPARWFTTITQVLLLQNAAPTSVLTESLVLLLMFVVFMAGGIKQMKGKKA